MGACRSSLDDASDDHERRTLLLSVIFNVARLAGEEGMSREQVARNVMGAVAAGFEDGVARRAAQGGSH
jgi:hypothetical protein